MIGARFVGLLAAGLFCVILAGCTATAPRPMAMGERRVVADLGRFDEFPAIVAGYRRVDVTEYRAPLVDYSIGYNRFDFEMHSAVTFYFYPASDDPARQRQQEEAEVLHAHPGARALSRQVVPLAKGGHASDALQTTFAYRESTGLGVEDLRSQLSLVFEAGRTFKVRHTVPAAQPAQADGAIRMLLDGVAWDR